MAALVDEGQIDWDDRVIDHDPSFRMYDPFVTRELRLRDLLCHRSGLPDHCGDLLEDIGYDRPEILRRLQFHPPASSFRAEYAYTNFGFSEAAFAVCKADGDSWEELAIQKLFVPLGMTSTSYRLRITPKLRTARFCMFPRTETDNGPPSILASPIPKLLREASARRSMIWLLG